MEVGEKVVFVIRANPKDVNSETVRRVYTLVKKYRTFGLFVSEKGVRECFDWMDVAKMEKVL